MKTYLNAPEEFVTTKPSIYHSLRMQPATDARTGQVRNSPAIARALASIDNLQFQDDIKNYSLPLSTNQGLPLYGRHVYPSELYSFNPSFSEKHLADLPVSYKRAFGDGTKNRPLNLYGFTGDAFTPQRFTNKTLQPEGIIYGNLDENDVVQLNTRPASAKRFSQVARALSPFHPSRDVKDLGVYSEDLARDIMDAGIPPILAESNVDTKGITQHLPFRLDDKIDVQEAHDPFAQYDMGNLNRPTPQELEQFTLDSIRAGEPMDIAMRLLKASLPTMREAGLSFEDLDALRFIPNYRKTSFYQPQLLNKPANITYEKNTASQKPEYKRIPGLQTELGPPQNNIHSYFVNPATRLGALAGDVTFLAEPTLLGIRNNDKDYGVDFWRTERQGAGSEGGEGLIYGELPKQNFAEIPINYHSADAMRAKLNLDHFMNTFGIPEEEAFEMLATRFPEVHNIASQFPNVSTQDTSWQQPAQYRGTNPLLLDEIDTKVASEPMDIAFQLLKEEIPYSSRDYPPQEIAVSTGTPLMGSKNSGPTPEVCNMPGCESGLPPVVYRRMANPIRSIDNHEFMCEQCAYKNDMQSLLYHKMLKGEITPMEYTMQLLKEEPLYLQGSNTLARRAREELQTDKTGANSPAYQEMMERMMDIYEPQDETIPLEDNLDQYAQETGINPWRSSPGQEIPNKHGGTAKVHLAPLTPIHTQPFYQWQAKNASEPMEIAMQLLKERVSPEAKRHKLEYDKKYESSPERVKYREELNRERRRRHIMGRGGPDMSHTKDHTIVPESPHTNRARHFKDKGTLL
jgi:hypothetical protein